MQKVKTYTKFKINEKAYRWRDDHGYWYIHCPSVMQVGFHEVHSSENDLLEKRYQESVAHTEPDYEKLHSEAIEKLKNSNHALKNSNQTLQDTITVAEQRYRKGYQQGYNAAIENIKSEMEVNLTRLARFRDNQLFEWRCHQTTEKVVGPPEYPLAHHTAAGLMKFKLEPVDLSESSGDRQEYRIYANGSVIHEDDFESLPEDYSDDFETISIPEELVDHIREDGIWLCKKCNRRVNAISYTSLCNDCNINGDETLAEATQTDQDKTASDVYLNTPWIHPVNETEEPTRPSEEDMINKPSVNTDPGRAYIEGQGYEQGRVVKRRHEIGNVAVKETFEPNYDQHPQFRDIGIRIDRYGKLVFKPELTDAKN